MEIKQEEVGNATVFTIVGDIDGNTAPDAQAQIVPLASPDAKIVLDMSAVDYMSSAGLRMLLVIYRTIMGQGGKVALVGLSEELQDTMTLTGFMDFFDVFESVSAGIESFG
ncbi:MAG: anti-sigma factor antagonist [Caldilineaceae bacterium]|nr:anti-sigma factor antagonist [Caldilineaceae bacterium]